MDYNITKITENNTDISTYRGMPTGGMPYNMLTSKFEETNLPHENVYDSYARNTLTNWGPDTTFLEHEKPRGANNRQYGKLQLQYYGHRGDEDTPYRAEHFDGFAGPENQDPRGINVDPDMKQDRIQHEARMRYHRFNADQSEHITSGGISEPQVIQNKQGVFNYCKNNLRVFDRQLDGRRTGLSRAYEHTTPAKSQIHGISYGEFIKDSAMTPQNRANILCESIKNSSEWRDLTLEDLNIIDYNTICRKLCNKTTNAHFGGMKTSDIKTYSALEHGIKYFTAAKLVSDLIKTRQMISDTNNTNVDHELLISKSADIKKCLNILLQSTDQSLSASDMSMIIKTGRSDSNMIWNLSSPQHDIFALNAQIISKSVNANKDTVGVSKHIVTDLNDAAKTAQLRKNAHINPTNTNNAVTDHVYNHVPSNVFNYKNLHITKSRDPLNVDTHRISQLGESDLTSFGKSKMPELDNKYNSVDQMKYSDNSQKERHAKGLGNKYMVRYIDRDESIVSI